LGTTYHVIFDYKNTPYTKLDGGMVARDTLNSPPASETMLPKTESNNVHTMRITGKIESKYVVSSRQSTFGITP